MAAAVRVGQWLRSNCDHFAHVQVMEFEVAASAKGLESRDDPDGILGVLLGWTLSTLYMFYSRREAHETNPL